MEYTTTSNALEFRVLEATENKKGKFPSGIKLFSLWSKKYN